MKTVCNENECCGCRVCIEICPTESIVLKDSMKNLNAIINEKTCINCNACSKICQINNRVKLLEPLAWYQGWETNQQSRSKSSSGGFAHSLMHNFINNSGYVCSCIIIDGNFKYVITDNINDLDKYRGSKYVKSDPSGIYHRIRNLINNHNKVLFIGLPCHVAALKKYIGNSNTDYLYTVDLICHGTPSVLLLKKYLEEHNVVLKDLENIQFRHGDRYQITAKTYDNRMIELTPNNVRDYYSIGFLNGLFFTDNCYNCYYAKKARVSDITIGDSWGSEYARDEGYKGISIALCQSEKGLELLKNCNLELKTVDLEKAINSNRQLKAPHTIPKKRDTFFRSISKHAMVTYAILAVYPYTCIRQSIKALLYKTGLKY